MRVHAKQQNGASRRAVLLGALITPILAGCAANDSLAQQAREGDSKNYIAGDGSVSEYAADKRSNPVSFTAKNYDGGTLDLQAWHGKPVVLNLWYASCAPCRKEAPSLVKMADDFKGKVEFLGINVRDEKGTAEAFQRNFKIPYPSVPDASGSLLLSLSKYVPPQAVPSTIILDRQGRVSARIIGLADESTLKSLIETAVSET